eukprot:scaffold494136_cov33-Prasinocladus_malaysianus.AAC.1
MAEPSDTLTCSVLFSAWLPSCPFYAHACHTAFFIYATCVKFPKPLAYLIFLQSSVIISYQHLKFGMDMLLAFANRRAARSLAYQYFARRTHLVMSDIEYVFYAIHQYNGMKRSIGKLHVGQCRLSNLVRSCNANAI